MCLCVYDRESDCKRSFQLKSMTPICTSQQTSKTLCAWCCKNTRFLLCTRRLSGAFERQFNDERQHAWMLVFCFRSQGRDRQSQNNFRSLIFFLRCHIHLKKIHVTSLFLTLLKVDNHYIPPRLLVAMLWRKNIDITNQNIGIYFWLGIYLSLGKCVLLQLCYILLM